MTQSEESHRNDIISEVRTAREQPFASCDYDLWKLAARLRENEALGNRNAISHPHRPPVKVLAA